MNDLGGVMHDETKTGAHEVGELTRKIERLREEIEVLEDQIQDDGRQIVRQQRVIETLEQSLAHAYDRERQHINERREGLCSGE